MSSSVRVNIVENEGPELFDELLSNYSEAMLSVRTDGGTPYSSNQDSLTKYDDIVGAIFMLIILIWMAVCCLRDLKLLLDEKKRAREINERRDMRFYRKSLFQKEVETLPPLLGRRQT